MLFAYDWSRDALVYPGPNGQPAFFPVGQLQQVGWTATSAGFRSSLPRFDASSLSTGLAPGPGNVADLIDKTSRKLNGGR